MTETNQTKKLALIAEDDPVSFMYQKSMMIEAGFNVIRAANGLEAVEICREHDDICIILMDINMPKMDGIEATRIIKSFRTGIPVIVVTAYSAHDIHKRAFDAGCIDLVVKPIVKAPFLKLIEKYAPHQT